jgi:hypothetical protein
LVRVNCKTAAYFFLAALAKANAGAVQPASSPVFGVLKRGGKIDAVTMLLGPVLTWAPATSNTPQADAVP